MVKAPDPPLYVFQDFVNKPQLLHGLHLELPAWAQSLTPASHQFYLGPPGSGAPVHFHGDALNLLAYGRKRWFLMHPKLTAYMRTPPVTWWKSKQPSGYEAAKRAAHLYECTQQPGEAIFVPKGWGHGTANIETSIGAAWELGHVGKHTA